MWPESYTLEYYTNSSATDNVRVFIRWLEPTLLAAVAPLVLFAEAAPVLLVQLGLALLLVPYLLRKITYGRFLISTAAALPLAAILFVALPLSIWVTPLASQDVWPEAARILWAIGVLLAMLHWVYPAESTITLTPDLTIDLTTDGTAETTGGFGKPDRVDRHGRLPASLVQLTIVYLFIGFAFTIGSLLILRSADKLPLLTALAERLPRLYSFWLIGFYNNEIGGIVLLFLPLATALLLGVNIVDRDGRYYWLRQSLVKGTLLLLLLLFSAALLLAQSRAAWLGAVLSLSVTLVLLGRRTQILLVGLAVIALIGLIAIGPATLFDQLTIESDIRSTDEIAAGVLADRNLSARFLIWQRALHGIADAPLTGMGLAAFQVVGREPYAPLAGYHFDYDIRHAHNLFLQIGLDLGLPGLFAFVLLLLLAVLALVRCYRRTPAQSPMRMWVIGLAGSLLAYLIYSMFDTVTLGAQRGVAFWFLLGLCLAAGELRSSPATPKPSSSSLQSSAILPQYEMQPLVHLPTVANNVANRPGQTWEYPTWVYIVEKTPHDRNE